MSRLILGGPKTLARGICGWYLTPSSFLCHTVYFTHGAGVGIANTLDSWYENLDGRDSLSV